MYMYIMMLDLTLVHVSILKGTSSSYQTKEILRRIKSAKFVHSCCVQDLLIWFYAVLLWFDSLMKILCGSKHLGMLSVVLYIYIYIYI
jgi:hypothetical protein